MKHGMNMGHRNIRTFCMGVIVYVKTKEYDHAVKLECCE
jgi:hypothetical protein